MSSDTGAGATLTADTLDIAGVVESLGELNQQGAKLEDTPLDPGSSSQKTYIPDDSFDGGELEVQLQVDRESALPAIHAVDTFTVNYPQHDDEDTPASWTGSAIIISRSLSQLARGERQLLTMTIALDGKETPFSWTPATAAA